MTRPKILSVIAGACLFGFATAAIAATGEYDNMCTMGLALGKEIKTDCSINATLQGKTYCFGNEEAKTMFMKDPAGNLAKAQAYYVKQEDVAADAITGPASRQTRRSSLLHASASTPVSTADGRAFCH